MAGTLLERLDEAAAVDDELTFAVFRLFESIVFVGAEIASGLLCTVE